MAVAVAGAVIVVGLQVVARGDRQEAAVGIPRHLLSQTVTSVVEPLFVALQ